MSDKKTTVKCIRTNEKAWDILRKYSDLHENPMGYTFCQIVYDAAGVQQVPTLTEWREIMREEEG